MKSTLLLILSFGVASMVSCTKDASNETNISSDELSTMASSDGMTLMRTTKQTDGKWMIKMNDIASKAFKDGIKNFPANSMITKERIDLSGTVTAIDVMYRTTADANSVDGWLFERIAPDGHVIYDASDMATACSNCHTPEGRSAIH